MDMREGRPWWRAMGVISKRISDFINDIHSVAPEQSETVSCIRRVFNEVDSALTEDIKYGGIVFAKSGMLIGGIFPYKNHISIEFSNGADFTDPDGLLEGSGLRRRHLKLRCCKDITEKKARYYIEQAVSEGLNK
jgi:hypothetical protein